MCPPRRPRQDWRLNTETQERPGLGLRGSPPTTPTSGERQPRRVGETLEMNKLGSEPQAAVGVVSTSCHVTIKSGDVLSKMKPDANTTLPSFKFKIEPNPCLILISD